MRALISLVIFASIVIAINLMVYPADTKNVVYLFGIYTLVVSFAAVFKLTFRDFEKMNLEERKEFMNDAPALVNVRGMFDGEEAKKKGFIIEGCKDI